MCRMYNCTADRFPPAAGEAPRSPPDRNAAWSRAPGGRSRRVRFRPSLGYDNRGRAVNLRGGQQARRLQVSAHTGAVLAHGRRLIARAETAVERRIDALRDAAMARE